jgi:hypothetical protein
MAPIRQAFSDRVKVTHSAEVLQLDGVPTSLRNRLWNVLRANALHFERDTQRRSSLMDLIADGFLGVALDDTPPSRGLWMRWFHKRFLQLEWYNVYNLIEFIAKIPYIDLYVPADGFAQAINIALEDEGSGYRLINGSLIPITNPLELESLQTTLQSVEQTGLKGVEAHFDTALRLFAKRPQPDYRNSIKEAISSVESLVTSTTNEKNFGRALQKLGKLLNLHPAFLSSLEKLYGYTSDEDGIRHGIFDTPVVGFEEAKFMLVACSALINYLTTKLAQQTK